MWGSRDLRPTSRSLFCAGLELRRVFPVSIRYVPDDSTLSIAVPFNRTLHEGDHLFLPVAGRPWAPFLL